MQNRNSSNGVCGTDRVEQDQRVKSTRSSAKEKIAGSLQVIMLIVMLVLAARVWACWGKGDQLCLWPDQSAEPAGLRMATR